MRVCIGLTMWAAYLYVLIKVDWLAACVALRKVGAVFNIFLQHWSTIFTVLQPMGSKHRYLKKCPKRCCSIGSKETWTKYTPLKGVWHEIFDFRFFFINQCPPGLWVFHWDRFEFFRKFAEIIAKEYLTAMSTTPAKKDKNFEINFFLNILFRIWIFAYFSLLGVGKLILAGLSIRRCRWHCRKIYLRCCWHRWTVFWWCRWHRR